MQEPIWRDQNEPRPGDRTDEPGFAVWALSGAVLMLLYALVLILFRAG